MKHALDTSQVKAVEDLFSSLRADVEAVFMQAPTVQLEALATKVDSSQPLIEEMVSCFGCN